MRHLLLTIFGICLCGISSASAQDYTTQGQRGSAVFQIDEFTGMCTLDWKATINVDRSQNVTFKELSFGCETRMDFDGHVGTIYADVEVHGIVDPKTLDLNPIPVNNTFRILPFPFPSLALSGHYFNRGFERSFNRVLEGPAQNLYLGLDYTNFPASIDFVNTQPTLGFYWVRPDLEIEPLLKFNWVEIAANQPPGILTMLPDPPIGIVDILGDSNHDGKFDSGDLVQVFQAGEYEDTIVGNSTWEEGDWNLDKDFNSTDLVAAFTAGTYANRAVDVPEPSTLAILLSALVGLGIGKWRGSCVKADDESAAAMRVAWCRANQVRDRGKQYVLWTMRNAESTPRRHLVIPIAADRDRDTTR